jgi:hypothetical protein
VGTGDEVLDPDAGPEADGLAGVATAAVETTTLSKVTALAAPVLCEVTASPASIEPLTPRVTEDPATAVQVRPSAEVYAVNVLPERATRTNAGTVPGRLACMTAFAPADGRNCTTIPLLGVTSIA